jgi:hypothetical protein
MDWSDPECGFPFFCPPPFYDIVCSTKEKLRSGEMVIPGDQWPIFLYARYEYDPEDPWKGLLRSSILVSVSCFRFTNYCLIY